MRTVNNPYGGVNPLIDKMIGNAYDIVKYVARYLKEIRYVAENMENVYIAANGNRVLLQADAVGDLDLAITIPDTLDLATAQSVTAMAYTTDGDIYLPGADTFNFGISGDTVTISISPSVSALSTATYKVQLTTNNTA